MPVGSPGLSCVTVACRVRYSRAARSVSLQAEPSRLKTLVHHIGSWLLLRVGSAAFVGVFMSDLQDYFDSLNRIRLENELVLAEERLQAYLLKRRCKPDESTDKPSEQSELTKRSVSELQRRNLW